ncbi:MAG: hypothetical protein KAJ75_00660 [Alphaproteobacteria bacterium]|nr:hypothetical protein [Alphaproteobacteria bacterium]
MRFSKFQRKIQILYGVFAVNLLFLIVLLPIMKLHEADFEHKKQSIQTELTNANAKVKSIKDDIDLINKSGDKYKALLAKGMLNKQDRLVAVRILEKQRYANNLNSLSYSFSEAEILKKTRTSKYNIQTTQLSLDIGAFLDRDFSKALHGIENSFSGAVIFKDITVKRIDKLKESHLEAIRKGKKPDLIKGKVSLLWRTFIEAGNK